MLSITMKDRSCSRIFVWLSVLYVVLLKNVSAWTLFGKSFDILDVRGFSYYGYSTNEVTSSSEENNDIDPNIVEDSFLKTVRFNKMYVLFFKQL